VVSGVDGTALFSADEVVLEGMSFRFMRGVGSGRGRIGFAAEVPRLLVEGTVNDLEYRLFPGLEPRLEGHFRLEGPVDDLALSGDLTVRQATLRRRDELASIISEWFLTESPPGAEGGDLELDLSIEADRTLEARSPFLRLVGSASLLVTGTSDDPGLVGSVEFMEGGDFTFQGVRYELDRGVITFSDPGRIDPHLDIAARGWIDTTQVTVRITGTLDRLVPVVTSDPPMSESELLSMMAFGRSGEGLGGTNLGLGVASSLLARQLNTELERRARELVPVDQVRVDPFAEVSTGNPTARVTVVKQLGPSWSLMLQTNLSTNREEVVVLRWFLGQGLFLEATRDLDGSVGVDVKLRRRY
jgi:translocation and assembly module TamB